MSDWFDPVVYREQAVAELLLKPQKVPHRRHFQPEVDPYSYTELLREPLPGITVPKAASDFRVRKLCLGFWRRVEQPEIHLLRLAAEQDLDGVAQLLGQEFVKAPNDHKAEAFYMAYRGLDLEQWHSVFRKETPAHFHPFGEAAFWLRLIHNVLDRVLYPFHAEGFVHCDFKPDNLCIPFSDVASEGSDVTGYLELSRVSLIDLGAAVGPVDAEMGGRSHTGIVVEAQDDSHPRRYVSDFYSQCREQELLALDGRADLYSFAYWLRDLLLESASGKGPWPNASLRGGIEASSTQSAALRELPGAIWSAADNYGQDGTLPHLGLLARIRHAESRVRDRYKFRVPFELSSADRHLVPSWSVLKGYRQDTHGNSSGRKLAPPYARHTENKKDSLQPPTGTQQSHEPVVRAHGVAPSTVHVGAMNPKRNDAIEAAPSAPTSRKSPSVGDRPQLAVPPPLPPNPHIASTVPSAVTAPTSKGKPGEVWVILGSVTLMLMLLAGLVLFISLAVSNAQPEDDTMTLEAAAPAWDDAAESAASDAADAAVAPAAADAAAEPAVDAAAAAAWGADAAAAPATDAAASAAADAAAAADGDAAVAGDAAADAAAAPAADEAASAAADAAAPWDEAKK